MYLIYNIYEKVSLLVFKGDCTPPGLSRLFGKARFKRPRSIQALHPLWANLDGRYRRR